MSQDPPPNVPISDPPPTHPQEVKAVAVDLGHFKVVLGSLEDDDARWWLLNAVSRANPIESLEVYPRDAAKAPIQAGARYRLLLIIEQDGP